MKIKWRMLLDVEGGWYVVMRVFRLRVVFCYPVAMVSFIAQIVKCQSWIL